MLVNLTPHAVVFVGPSGETILSVPPSGSVARLASRTVSAGSVDGVPLSRVDFGDVEGLPSPVEGTMYIVAAMVRAALPTRLDLASPGDLYRNTDGVVIGCKSLIVN